MQPAPDPQQLDRVFSALANSTRRALLAQIAEGEMTINELVEASSLQQPAISKHIKTLEAAGLVRRTRNAHFRPCHLEPAPLREAFEWLGAYRQFWDASFDRLESYVATLLARDQDQDQEDET